MNPIVVSLAENVMAILMPYAAKTAKEFIGMAGEVGYERARALFARLKAKWTGDTGSTVILENFDKQPEQFKPAMQAVLQQKLSEDHELQEELSQMIEEMGPILEIIQRMDEGQNVTGLEADEVASGRVSITQEVKKGKDVTGAKLGRIG